MIRTSLGNKFIFDFLVVCTCPNSLPTRYVLKLCKLNIFLLESRVRYKIKVNRNSENLLWKIHFIWMKIVYIITTNVVMIKFHPIPLRAVVLNFVQESSGVLVKNTNTQAPFPRCTVTRSETSQVIWMLEIQELHLEKCRAREKSYLQANCKTIT